MSWHMKRCKFAPVGNAPAEKEKKCDGKEEIPPTGADDCDKNAEHPAPDDDKILNA